MMAILHDKIRIAKTVNVTVLKLEQAVQGYKEFDKGAAKKFMLGPHAIKDRQFGIVNIQPEFQQVSSGLDAARKWKTL